jgi:hemicentin
MTGDCGNRTHPGYTAFEKIASASSGQVFHLEKTDVKEVLNYVRVSVQTRRVNIEAVDRVGEGTYLVDVPVDTYLNELHVSVSGGDPRVTLIDPNGRTVDELTTSLNIDDAYASSLRNPIPGMWQLRTIANGRHSLRVTGIGAIAFTHGFAAKIVPTIDKTHGRPLRNVQTYLMINMTGLFLPGSVQRISLVNLTGEVLYTGEATQDRVHNYLYSTGPLVPPMEYFFIKVSCIHGKTLFGIFQVVGKDDRGRDFKRFSITALSAETEGAPRVYMQPQTTAYRMASVNLTCDVDSRAPYTLYFTRGTQQIGVPLYFKYVYG